MVSYTKLWKLLLDKGMTKTELRMKTNMSTSTLAKLGKDEQVSMEILIKICEALNCDIGDIMTVSKNKEDGNEMLDRMLEHAAKGELGMVLVQSLDRLCEDPKRRAEIIEQLKGYGVEIVEV